MLMMTQLFTKLVNKFFTSLVTKCRCRINNLFCMYKDKIK